MARPRGCGMDAVVALREEVGVGAGQGRNPIRSVEPAKVPQSLGFKPLLAWPR